ncbi:hypothetical protein DPEC_G00346240 [Dallia pectoralis]|uniref:Uncharacterized protein n=1 Tax=Dallia pectoralis TaxID=75939 RepID=A0ACC2F462_DALPE|nr:hypothetical protein DPEC_G00346240 [Dallia pectoralis]
MSLSKAPARDTSETPSQTPRERIRSHMKMVINQLDGILKELKDVAKELREDIPAAGQSVVDHRSLGLELQLDFAFGPSLLPVDAGVSCGEASRRGGGREMKDTDRPGDRFIIQGHSASAVEVSFRGRMAWDGPVYPSRQLSAREAVLVFHSLSVSVGPKLSAGTTETHH